MTLAALGQTTERSPTFAKTGQKAEFEVRYVEIFLRTEEGITYDSRKVAPGFPIFSSYIDPDEEVFRLPFSQLGVGKIVPGNVEIRRYAVTNQWAVLSHDDFKKYKAQVFGFDGVDYLSTPKFDADLGVPVYRGMLNTNAIEIGPYRRPPEEVDSGPLTPKFEWTTSVPPNRRDFMSHSGTNFLVGVSIRISALHHDDQ